MNILKKTAHSSGCRVGCKHFHFLRELAAFSKQAFDRNTWLEIHRENTLHEYRNCTQIKKHEYLAPTNEKNPSKKQKS